MLDYYVASGQCYSYKQLQTILKKCLRLSTCSADSENAQRYSTGTRKTAVKQL